MGSIPKELHGGWYFGLIKKIVILFEIATQFDIILVPAVPGYQFGIRCIAKPRRKNGQADLFLAGIIGLHTVDKQFPDHVISHGKASRRDAGTMNEDVISQMPANTTDAVGGIRIIDLHRQIVFAVGIQSGDMIKPLRNL